MAAPVPAVRIRPLEPRDAPALERFYLDLTQETRCLRFCAACRGVTHDQAAWFCRREADQHAGLVAVAGTGAEERIAGHLCIEPEGPDRAELALVVAEAFQGFGIGRRLVREGVARARAMGIRTLTAIMFVGNQPIHRLLTTLGLPSTTTFTGAGTCRLEIDLTTDADLRCIA